MPLYRQPRWLLELFVWNNLAFLSVDTLLAHSVNDFALWQEWIPVGFSVVGSIALLHGLTPRGFGSDLSSAVGGLIGYLAIGVGLLGFLCPDGLARNLESANSMVQDALLKGQLHTSLHPARLDGNHLLRAGGLFRGISPVLSCVRQIRSSVLIQSWLCLHFARAGEILMCR